MRRKRNGLLALAGMMFLILDSATALDGARAGIELCLKTMVPALFPFFILSGIITRCFTGGRVPLLKPLGKLCGIPEGAESLLLTGFLGGYPVGAACVADAWRCGVLTREEAQRMLGFCNNAGPSFLFGMTAALFPQKAAAWLLWGIQILSAIWAGMLLPDKASRRTSPLSEKEVSLPKILKDSVHTMAVVCGWVIAFRVLIGYLQKWISGILPSHAEAAVIGLMELSNGCWALFSVDSLSVRFLLCALLLSFGGLCVGMQTAFAANGLSLKRYYQGKLLQCLCTLILCLALLGPHPWLILLLGVPFLGKRKKTSSIPALPGI